MNGKSIGWRALLGMACLLAAASTMAQKTYRCGSVYQDRPCAGQDGKVVNSSGAGQANLPRSDVDADCDARGERAQKMVWAREAGKTERDQAAAGDADLVREVYKLRGNASEVRKTIESNCMARKTRTDAAAPEAAAKAAPAASAVKAASAPTSAETEAAARQKAQCASLRAQIDAVKLDQRAGGDGQRLEALKRKQRDLERALAEQGC